MSPVAMGALADVDDAELVSIALDGLSPSTAFKYQKSYVAYSQYRQSASTGAALRELITLNRDKALRLVEDFRAHMQRHGRSRFTIADRLSSLRSATRQFRKAGLTTQSLDPDYPRAEQPEPAGPLMSIATKGRSPKTAKNYRLDLETFGTFIKADSAEEALRKLIGMRPDRANRVVNDYLAARVKKGMSTSYVSANASTFRSCLKALRIEGLTTLALDIDLPPVETLYPAGDVEERDLKRLLARAKTEAKKGCTRELPLILLSYDLGLWAHQVVALDLADVDLERPAVRAEGCWIEVSDGIRDALAAWIETRWRWEGPLFTRGSIGKTQCSRLTAKGMAYFIRMLSIQAGLESGITPLDLVMAGRRKRQAGAAVSKPDVKPTYISDVFIGSSNVEPPRIGKTVLPLLTKSEFEVLEVLKRYEPEGIVTPKLDEESHHRQPDKILRKLIKKVPHWDTRIHFPGKKGRGGVRLGPT